MKTAFVGKGGSGKSTVSALFINYLVSEDKKVLAIDADINQHLAHLLGISFEPEKAVSHGKHARAIRTHLRGTNKHIDSVDSFIKTTPPGEGSNLIRISADDPVLQSHAAPFAKNGYFVHVGTYEKDGIGTSCYHGNLAIFENIVSHTQLHKDEYLVGDMVAGTDAFASAAFALFDAICIVVEPTPESTSVYKQFIQLANEAGIQDRVHVIGNKIMDKEDERYLAESIGHTPAAIIPHNARLRRLRQTGERVTCDDPTIRKALEGLLQTVSEHIPTAESQRQLLKELHLKLAETKYIQDTYGDVRSQFGH
jgi:CO dehydrogenase maturation factor